MKFEPTFCPEQDYSLYRHAPFKLQSPLFAHQPNFGLLLKCQCSFGKVVCVHKKGELAFKVSESKKGKESET